ncbi:MAG: RNA-binding ATPase activator esf2 [Pleopsidium flavum]|nr:MAG: RNA-binding ATPase activator esf2 [Pleopsidium flavum]
MTTRKRNEFLEDNFSDIENDQGYDSEAVEESKGSRLDALSSRGTKRRKLDREGGKTVKDSEHSADSDLDEAKEEQDTEDDPQNLNSNTPTPPNNNEQAKTVPPATTNSSANTLKPLTTKKLESTALTARKTGVIYLSRIPPFMKPQTVRHLLNPFGAITKIFLTPEPPSSHTQRTKSGGNKKRSFIDGWVEFSSKKDAKLCAETLNTQIVGGKKGGWYHDDVWNIKYLKGFKWHHLTEQIANENAERAARLRADISRVGRENKHFLQNVERAKMLEGMEGKKKKKRARDEEERGDGGDGLDKEVEKVRRPGQDNGGYARHFRQSEVKRPGVKDGIDVEQPAEVKRVLSKIF